MSFIFVFFLRRCLIRSCARHELVHGEMKTEQKVRVLEFYSYPTAVCDIISRREEMFDDPEGDVGVKILFEDCLEAAERKLKRHLMDNKIAMKVVYELGPLKTEFFVGYKDNAWSIGRSLNPYMTGRMTKVEEDL